MKEKIFVIIIKIILSWQVWATVDYRIKGSRFLSVCGK